MTNDLYAYRWDWPESFSRSEEQVAAWLPYGEGMSGVRLTGQLVCSNLDEARLVMEYLPEHVRLTRLEPGCLVFNVTQTTDPFVWRVEESFEDETLFKTHQERGVGSEWGRMTGRIERRYAIEGLSR